MKSFICILLIYSMLGVFHLQAQETDTTGMANAEKLLEAVDRGDSVEVVKLLDNGVPADAVTWDGVTGLMYATQNGDLGLMSLLIQHGADPNKKPLNGVTALINAIENGRTDLAEFLIRHGADVDLADNENMTPLMHAVVVDSFYLPDMLLYYGASVNAVRQDGVDALMIAAWQGRYIMTVKILEDGAPINRADKEGRTPLHWAVLGDHVSIMAYLIGQGADLEARTISGYTPLSLAVLKDNYAATRLLLASGANVNSRISATLNPLELARMNHSDSIALMLKNNNAVATAWPWFNRVSFGGQFQSSFDDMLVGVRLGLNDRKYNLWTSLGYAFRPGSMRVLQPDVGGNYFQFWEKRNMIFLELDKAFILHGRNRRQQSGFFAGLEESCQFGSYRGSYRNPEIQYILSPRAGVFYQTGYLRVRLNYSYLDLHLLQMHKSWYGLSLEIMLNRKKGNAYLDRIPDLN